MLAAQTIRAIHFIQRGHLHKEMVAVRGPRPGVRKLRRGTESEERSQSSANRNSQATLIPEQRGKE